VAAYRRREFNAALATFEALGKERPSDGPVALYVLRCKSYLAEPPGPEWDGVWEGASRH
jgi:adenylate cyclase